jgi:hypothetical protein
MIPTRPASPAIPARIMPNITPTPRPEEELLEVADSEKVLGLGVVVVDVVGKVGSIRVVILFSRVRLVIVGAFETDLTGRAVEDFGCDGGDGGDGGVDGGVCAIGGGAAALKKHLGEPTTIPPLSSQQQLAARHFSAVRGAPISHLCLSSPSFGQVCPFTQKAKYTEKARKICILFYLEGL